MSSLNKSNNPRIIREGGWKIDPHGLARVENIQNDTNAILNDNYITTSNICRSNCKTCPDFIDKTTFRSTVTGREYSLLNHTNETINCKSQNIIYLLTCKNCFTQNVGETVQKCHKRMNVHRKGKCGCDHVIEHFSDCCKDASFFIQIIEKFPGNGYKDGVVDEAMRRKRLEKEDWWMKTPRTIYPYGLNERCKNKNLEPSSVGKLFYSLPRLTLRQNKRNRIRKDKSKKKLAEDTVKLLEDIECIIKGEKSKFLYTIRILLDQKQNRCLKRIWPEIQEINKREFDWEKRCYEVILDIIDTKIVKLVPKMSKKPRPRFNIPIKFVNKGFDFINLSQILKEEDIISLIPGNVADDDKVPAVVYSLTGTIRNTVFNYKDVVSKIDVNDKETFGTGIKHCDCFSQKLSDNHHQHVITGDLRIVKNTKLRKLLSKGPNYREARTIRWNECLDKIKTGLQECSANIAVATKTEAIQLIPWQEKIMGKVEEKVTNLKIKIKPQHTKPILKQADVKLYLDEFQKRYVLVPTDKASNNIAIVCKTFYVPK